MRVFTDKEKKELIEARRQEMEHILPNNFTICLGERIPSKEITFHERRKS